ncbi:hypothetical protein FIBSPDRAFT_339589 [Athelia psychrophila]|uniref:Uncharacterized protein n=1 Tax=Athelia psychrophila TaxID=1759441 RepID=A0A167W7Y9_9AGAM|nr:hypothetical protein FIBSPDRAFT_339589 [Fibularhizoctonia sp. CBS 109695]
MVSLSLSSFTGWGRAYGYTYRMTAKCTAFKPSERPLFNDHVPYPSRCNLFRLSVDTTSTCPPSTCLLISMAPTSTPIMPRPTSFTPNQPLSSVSGSISSTSSMASASSAATVDSTTANVGGTSRNPIKKFQAALSSH